ncbi:MAG: hypothetical protein P8Z81_13325 [Deinococcales bacterium]|jgi:hypothetical protein
MTREEALKRLEGTWSFDMLGDQVMLRELDLLSAVAAVRREPAGGERSHVATGPLQSAAASGD